jgi:opacity protein-like surface antigen
MGGVGRFRLKMMLVVIGLMGVTSVRAEIPRLPFVASLGGGLPVMLDGGIPLSYLWCGEFAAEGGMEFPFGNYHSFRVQGAYQQFHFHAPSEPWRHPYSRWSSHFFEVTFDFKVAVTRMDSRVRPYVAAGLGYLSGNISAVSGGSCVEQTGAGTNQGIDGHAGLGVEVAVSPRLRVYLEGDYHTLLMDVGTGTSDYLGFIPVSLGLSFR